MQEAKEQCGEVLLLEGGTTGRRHQQPLQQQQSARRRAVVSHISAGIWGAALILALLPHAVSGSDSDDDPSKVVKHHAFDPFSGWGHMGTISKGYKIEHEAIAPIKPIECDDPDACTSSPTVDAPPAPPPPWSTRSTVPSPPPPPPPAPPPSPPAPPAKSTPQATSRRGRSGSSKKDDGPQPPPLPAFLGGASPPPPPPAAAAPSNKGVVGVKSSASDAKISAMERLRARKLVFDIKRLIGDADGMKDKAGVHKQASGGNGVLNDTADTIERVEHVLDRLKKSTKAGDGSWGDKKTLQGVEEAMLRRNAHKVAESKRSAPDAARAAASPS